MWLRASVLLTLVAFLLSSYQFWREKSGLGLTMQVRVGWVQSFSSGVNFTSSSGVHMTLIWELMKIDWWWMRILPLTGRKILQMLKFSWCKFFGILLYLMAGLQALLRKFYVGNLQSTIVSNNIHLSAYWSSVTWVWYSTMQSMSALDLLDLGFWKGDGWSARYLEKWNTGCGEGIGTILSNAMGKVWWWLQRMIYYYW